MSVRLNPIIAAGTALILALAAAALAVPVEKAGAATLTACVNKKTGEMKMRFGKKAKKKCPKGYKKVSWNDSSTGKLPSVYGADGSRVGEFLGSTFIGAPYPFYAVLRNGGQYIYLAGSGEMIPLGSPSFTNASCTGTAYLEQSGATPSPTETTRFIKALGGTNRIIFRTQSATGDYGTPLAWTGDGTAVPAVAVSLYELNEETGACQAAAGGPFTGTLFGLRSVTVPTPYDFQGPLSLR